MDLARSRAEWGLVAGLGRVLWWGLCAAVGWAAAWITVYAAQGVAQVGHAHAALWATLLWLIGAPLLLGAARRS